jgi:hypothetical protein
MKILSIISLLLLMTNCTAHNVKLGKRCTTADINGSFEKSYVWFVDEETVKSFDKKINKKNCKKNS